MNIQQLEYIVAVEEYQHFGKAAEHCRVTQPTLSMMIQKLEEELDIKLFDRSVQPVRPTGAGTKIIEQARKVLHQVSLIKDIGHEEKHNLSGTFRIAVLPTVAPYLLLLSVIELIGGKFGNKGHTVSAFHHSHKSFEAAQFICNLMHPHVVHLAKSYQLVSETMPLVQEPKMFPVNIRSSYQFIFEYSFIIGYIPVKFFII